MLVCIYLGGAYALRHYMLSVHRPEILLAQCEQMP